MRYLDPKNDMTFKKVFGQHPHLLKSFLNALLPLKEDEQIVDLEYLPAEMVPDIPLSKNTIVDVRCFDQKGRQFIVEMQMHWTTSFMQRVLFNASKAYIRQLDKKEEYKLLQPVYALSLVNENFEMELSTFYHHYKIVHTEHNDKQIKGLEFVFVELPKFKAKNMGEKKLQVLWLRYLTEIDDKTVEIDQRLLDNPDIRQAIEEMEESAFTKAELETYDKYWDIIRTEKTLLTDAKDEGLFEGEKIGIEKGRAEGKAEGRAEGIQIGLYKTGLKMLRKKMSFDQISDLTGLSASEIEKLAMLLQKYSDDAENHLTEIE
jgi:predicted transposase/invertase (TIGR01784 family)